MIFEEQIKKGLIEVINKDTLIIENYPFGSKKCVMTFKKVLNRNGQIIERTSNLNGKISQPKKTTASRLNIFIFDKELNRHFILMINDLSLSIYNTNFKCGGIYSNYYYDLTNKKNLILLDYFKDYLNISNEVYLKIAGGLE